ncbi:MAG: M48 family metallopeptidase [Oscillospiraceae bacterium]|nr:M48 family metallopeptidase [Oscillospiraceae bacterium]
MKAISSETRKVETDCGTIEFTFERKKIKNINLRIKNDGSVYVSAPLRVPFKTVERFVISKSEYIRNAVRYFSQREVKKTEMKYVSGESVTMLGKKLHIKVENDSREYVSCDGINVNIHVRQPDNYNRKRNLLNAWLDKQCLTVFEDVMHEVHKKFAPYNIAFPQLKIRRMTSRWGSFQPFKGVITLNRRLIEAPKNCIEYVVFHEFCHFIHPDHSKKFYALLQIMLPDWKECKRILEESIIL